MHLSPTLGHPCDGVLCLDCTKCDRCGYSRVKPEPGKGRHFPHRYVEMPQASVKLKRKRRAADAK